MKKVDIVTYCEWHSYGSVLQALSLKMQLTFLGYDVKHIRLNTVSSKELKLYFKGKHIKTILTNLHRFFIKKKIQRKFNLITNFLSNNFNFLVFDDYEELKANPPLADAYIAGSDQIWNPHNIRPVFYLDFVADDRKKISYAASMGDINIPIDNRKKWYELVGKFQHISVRENEMKAVINAGTDKNTSVHIDPTLLTDKEEWRKIEKSYPIKRPYILVYPLWWDAKLNAQLKELHKKTGLPIVAIASQLQTVYANKRIYDASVEEFLWLFDHAEYVITSSFHGAAFSVIFEKKFSVVINPSKPSRLESLFRLFEMENTCISDLASSNGPDYEKIRQILKNEREKANEYLSGAMEQE